MGKLSNILLQFKKKMMNQSQYQAYLRKCGLTLGRGCDIHKDAVFGPEPWLIKLGNNVRITRGVKFITHDGGLWTLRRMGLIDEEAVKYGSIEIGDNCNISWDVTIMPNVKIGKNCVIAAGAVVTKSIPDGTVWGGVPAKQIETIEMYHEKIKDQTVPTNHMTSEEKKKYLSEHKPELFK